MRQIIPNLYLIEGLLRANVYLLVSDGGLTLVDTGPARFGDRIVEQLEGAGYALSDLDTIVLTHWHGDHTGNAAELARRSGAEVVAHRDEIPFIEQTQPEPAASSLGRLLNALGNRVLLRRAPCRVDRPVQDGDVVDALGGLQVIHTPGHSPGAICLHQPELELLFCGDALFNVHPITGVRGLGLHMRLLTSDYAQARRSLGELPLAAIQVLCPGHGEPIVGGAGAQIEALLEASAA